MILLFSFSLWQNLMLIEMCWISARRLAKSHIKQQGWRNKRAATSRTWLELRFLKLLARAATLLVDGGLLLENSVGEYATNHQNVTIKTFLHIVHIYCSNHVTWIVSQHLWKGGNENLYMQNGICIQIGIGNMRKATGTTKWNTSDSYPTRDWGC